MNTSPASSRRRLLASTGAVLGMLATVGLAAPAQASVTSPSATSVVQNNRSDDYDGHGKGHDERNRNHNNWNYNWDSDWDNNHHDSDKQRNHRSYNNGEDRGHNRNHYNDYDHNNHNNDSDADLRLRIDRDGDYRIRGNDYEDNRVRVVLRDVSRGRTVDSFTVYPNRNGDFTVRGDDLRCNRTYQAVSWSNDDGRDYSNKVRLHCDRKY